NFNDAAATTATTNIINSASQLKLGGQTAGLGQVNVANLIMAGKNNAASVQSFASTNIDIYGSVITVNKGPSTSTSRINPGALAHNPGGTVFIPTSGGAIGTITTTTNVTTTNGILGGWAIAGAASANQNIQYGTDWATVGPDNGDGTRNIIAYTGYVTAPSAA